jgi:hypothetical protein
MKFLKLDGYSSTSLDEKTARYFAMRAKNEENEMILLKITMVNETGRYFFCLDRLDYTAYPDELEVLL